MKAMASSLAEFESECTENVLLPFLTSYFLLKHQREKWPGQKEVPWDYSRTESRHELITEAVHIHINFLFYLTPPSQLTLDLLSDFTKSVSSIPNRNGTCSTKYYSLICQSISESQLATPKAYCWNLFFVSEAQTHWEGYLITLGNLACQSVPGPSFLLWPSTNKGGPGFNLLQSNILPGLQVRITSLQAINPEPLASPM